MGTGVGREKGRERGAPPKSVHLGRSSSSETQGQIVGTRESLNGRKNMARRKVKNRPFRLSLAPFIYPWVSEDGRSFTRLVFSQVEIKVKVIKCCTLLHNNIFSSFPCFTPFKNSLLLPFSSPPSCTPTALFSLVLSPSCPPPLCSNTV